MPAKFGYKQTKKNTGEANKSMFKKKMERRLSRAVRISSAVHSTVIDQKNTCRLIRLLCKHCLSIISFGQGRKFRPHKRHKLWLMLAFFKSTGKATKTMLDQYLSVLSVFVNR